MLEAVRSTVMMPVGLLRLHGPLDVRDDQRAMKTEMKVVQALPKTAMLHLPLLAHQYSSLHQPGPSCSRPQRSNNLPYLHLPMGPAPGTQTTTL